MIVMDLQLFGGRGSRAGFFPQPDDSKWSEAPADSHYLPADTLKEAIGAKGSPKSIGDAVVETNPHHSYDYKEFSHNCQRCVIAYELRRRGYDVEALPTFQGDVLNRIAYYNKGAGTYEARWRGAFRDAKTVSVGARGNTPAAEQKVMDNISNKMRSFGSGSRAVIQILYRGGGGHVFNVENQGGRIVYVEAQSGKIKNMPQVMKSVNTDSVNLVRVDNLKISDRAKQFVTQKKRK